LVNRREPLLNALLDHIFLRARRDCGVEMVGRSVDIIANTDAKLIERRNNT
jgi:hypothetical protein